MPVPSTAVDISTTASSNSPAGSDLIGNTLDEYIRAVQAILKQQTVQGADIASAATIVPLADGNTFDITGSVTITGISSTYSWTGRIVYLKFDAALTLTHNATTLILPGGANITTSAGDWAAFRQDASGQWRCIFYQYVSGSVITGTQTITANSSSAALTVTQTGSGDVVNFLDSAGDTSIFKVNANGGVTIANNSTSSNLYSDFYTPTLTNGGNVDSSTAAVCQYMVLGSVCTVSGSVEINTAASGVASEIEMSLPVASDFSGAQQAGGTFVNASASDATLRDCGSIRADATDNRVIFRFFPATSANQTYYFSFTYAIV